METSYPSLHVIRMIKPRYTARTGEKYVHIFIGEPEGSRPHITQKKYPTNNEKYIDLWQGFLICYVDTVYISQPAGPAVWVDKLGCSGKGSAVQSGAGGKHVRKQ